MKAIVVREFGGPDVMKLEDVPVPAPVTGELLLRVAAVGVNPVDGYIRSGSYARKPTLPYTPGTDIAGTVEQGSGVAAGSVDRQGIAVPVEGGDHGVARLRQERCGRSGVEIEVGDHRQPRVPGEPVITGWRVPGRGAGRSCRAPPR